MLFYEECSIFINEEIYVTFNRAIKNGVGCTDYMNDWTWTGLYFSTFHESTDRQKAGVYVGAYREQQEKLFKKLVWLNKEPMDIITHQRNSSNQ